MSWLLHREEPRTQCWTCQFSNSMANLNETLWCWAVHTGPVEGTGPSGHPHEMSFSLFGHTSGLLEAGGILLDYLCNIDRVQVFMKV